MHDFCVNIYQMKLLLLSTSSSRNAGGLYNSVRSLGQELMKDTCKKIALMAFHDEKSYLDNHAYKPLDLIQYSIFGPANIAFTLDLKSCLNKFKPDLIHMQGIWLYTSLVNSRYCKKNNIPYLISPRGMLDTWILKRNPWKKKLGLYFYERRHVQNSKCLHALCVSEYEAIRRYGYKKPVAIIPNGVNIPEKKDPDCRLKLPDWKLKDERKVMLFLGRLHTKKGLDNLIKAWANVDPSEWRLVIAGESQTEWYSNSLKQSIAKLGLDKHIDLIGPQFHNDKDLVFRCSDAFILPSYSEGMPMSILEAWSYSLPVLMTDGCNLTESFGQGAAYRIHSEVNSLSQEINGFLQLSSEDKAEIARKGFLLVKEKYTWSSIAVQFKELYEWCQNSSNELPSFVKLD